MDIIMDYWFGNPKREEKRTTVFYTTLLNKNESSYSNRKTLRKSGC